MHIPTNSSDHHQLTARVHLLFFWVVSAACCYSWCSAVPCSKNTVCAATAPKHTLFRRLSHFIHVDIRSHFVFCHNSLQLIICLINYICAVGWKDTICISLNVPCWMRSLSKGWFIYSVSDFTTTSLYFHKAGSALWSSALRHEVPLGGLPVHRRSAVSPTLWRGPISLSANSCLGGNRVGNSLSRKQRNFAHELSPQSKSPFKINLVYSVRHNLP